MLWLPDILYFAKFKDGPMFNGVLDVLKVLDEYEVNAKMSEIIYKNISPFIYKDIEAMVKSDKILNAIWYVIHNNFIHCDISNFMIISIWKYIVHLIIDLQHQKRELVNQLLIVVRKALTHEDPTIRMQSYISWRYLVKNFTSNENILLSPRITNLLMEPIHSMYVIMIYILKYVNITLLAFRRMSHCIEDQKLNHLT